MRVGLLFGVLVNGFVVDPNTPPLCNFVMPVNVYIGTMVPLCVFMMSAPVGDPSSASYVAPQIKSIAFGVSVDEYSMLDLSESFSLFNHPQDTKDNIYAWVTGAPTQTGWPQECALDAGAPQTWTDINSGVAYSCPQLVMTPSAVAPMASLVATLNNGVLEDLVWDNQCQTCSKDECLAGNLSLMFAPASQTQQYLTGNPQSGTANGGVCSVPFSDCESINCDFRVLLTWQGTDAEGKILNSSSLKMTEFSGQSVDSMWDSVAKNFNPDD